VRHGTLLALVWATAGLVVPPALLHFVGRQEVHIPSGVHFWAVFATALAATGAALALSVIGTRRRDGRVVLLATSFTAMAALLAVHGIATPGFLVEDNGIVALSGGLTLPVGGALLALSALPSLRRPRRLAPLLWLQGTVLAVIAGVSALGLLAPGLVPSVPDPLSPAALALLAAGLVFYLAVGIRALRTWLLTRRHADLVAVLGLVWLAAALVAALTLDYWDLGWWLGHGFELAGIAFVGGVVAWDLHRAAQSRPLIGDLGAEELVAEEEAFLGSHVRSLVERLAEKDVYTEGHTRRVALLAVRVGEELRLSPLRLRALAAGALMHDIGKLAIPDDVLKKPGELTARELDLMREHPDRGRRLLGELGGFSPSVHRLVRRHHERLDGSGYPEALTGDDIELESRILAVCDVYDALVSARTYRGAWSHDDAIAMLRESVGRLFDARCVHALERVLERSAQPRGATAPSGALSRREAPVASPLMPHAPTVFAATPEPPARRD
jgi:hypothetical protein